MSNWTDVAIAIFPWIGGGAAIVLSILLFGTRVLRGESSVSRWRDHVWLSWLGTVIYLLHNVEEYGIDVFGRMTQFPVEMCSMLKLPPYPDCPLPFGFFLAVNIPLFWLAAPIGALMSRRHPLVGFATYGVIFVNFFAHVIPFIAGLGFSPGTFTALVLFLPISVWVIYACFGNGRQRLNYKALGLVFFNGVLLHIILMAPMQLFIRGYIGTEVLIGSQLVNAILFILVPWVEEKWLGSALTKPA